MEKMTSLKRPLPEYIYTQKELQQLYRGLVPGNKPTFQKLLDMRGAVHKKLCTQASDLEIIQMEIKVATKFIKITSDPDLAEKIALYRDFLYEVQKPVAQIIKKPQRQKYNTLAEACSSPKEHEALTAWFTQNEFCDPETLAWNNKIFTLSTLAGYMKDLNKKVYTHKITQADIKTIAKNSFHVEIGIDCIKRAKKPTPEIPFFKG